MTKQQTLSDRVKSITLARFFPVIGLLCITALVAAFSLANFKITDSHQEVLDDFDAALSANIDALDNQSKSLASNDLIINSLIDFSNRDSYLPVFFRSLIPVRLTRASARYSIVFLDFEGEVIAGNGVDLFNEVKDLFNWYDQTLLEGEPYRQLDDNGLLFVHPVIYGAATEGAIALYIEHISDIASFSNTDIDLYLSNGKSVLYASPNAVPLSAAQLKLNDADGVVNKKASRSMTVYVRQNYQSAYQDALWILVFMFIALAIVMLALLFVVKISSDTASAIINRLRDEVANATERPDDFSDIEAGESDSKEIHDLRITFNKLMNALLTTTFAKDQVEGIIESLGEMIVVFDTEMQTMMSNASFDNFYNGTVISTIEGKRPIDLFPDDFVITSQNSHRELITTPLDDGGVPRTISWHRTLYKDSAGNLIGIVLAGVDITETQQMQRELSIKNKAIDEAQTPIIITDATKDGFPITYVNRAFEIQTGYEANEVLGNNCNFLQGPGTEDADIQKIRDALSANKPTTVNILNYRKDGTSFYNRLILTPLVNDEGKVTHVIGFQQDITSEQQTKDYLEAAKVEAEESAKLKSEFLASMSHEIRTPMNGILGMLGLVQNTQLSTEQAQHIKLAKSSADALLVLINDILDFSKIEAGKLEIESVDFDIVNLLSEISTSMAVVAEDKRLELILDTSALSVRRINSDPGRLRQVINNLIGNAIKFTERGHIIVQARSIASKSNHQKHPNTELPKEAAIEVSITDTGVGIPKERTATIFDSFSQVDASTTRKFGGTGLGLTICKQLADLMGGDITVDSTLGTGSTFTLSFSCALNNEEQIGVQKDDLKELKVLIADHSVVSAHAIENQLSNWGVESAVASTYEDITVTLQDNHYDLALLDARIIKDNPTRRMNDLRNQSKNSQLALCLMTSFNDAFTGETLQASGSDSCVQKPITPNLLFDLIHTSAPSVMINEPATSASHEDKAILPQGLRALLVEDNPINQLLAITLLEAEGLEVTLANNGKEALDALTTDDAFQIIFMDCQMPEMDGYEATHHIREGHCGDHYKHIPIIAMTANAIAGDREKCLDAGMSDYISKPIDTQLLKQRIIFWSKDLNPPLSKERRDKPCDKAEISDTSRVDHDNDKKDLAASTTDNAANAVKYKKAVWDYELALERTMGREDLLIRVLNAYLKDTPHLVERIALAVDESNMQEIAFLAHTIKGASLNISARQLSETSALIESDAKKGDDQHIAKAVRQLELQSAELFSTLTKFTSKKAS